MKKILIVCLCVYFALSSATAQKGAYIRPSGFGFSFVLNDYATPQRIRNGSITQVFRDKKWAKLKEMGPGIAVNYYRGITNHLDIAATLAASSADVPDVPAHDDLLLEGDVSAQLKMMTDNYYVQPYLSAGIGGSKYGGYYGAFIPLGMGLKINVSSETSVIINTQYRIPVTTETNGYHFFHSIGIAANIGKKKAAPVKEVIIPEVKDTDGDGIADDKDKCPTQAGVAKYDGCPIPDTDKDGINDEEDKCPQVAGLSRYQGCPIPDSDNDGINDEEDKCPSVPGVARYEGCPVPDTDKDGVNDEEDKCPSVPGVKENKGCPVIAEEVKKKIDYAAQNIYFSIGSYKLLSKSYKGLNEVVQIMNENPDTKLMIDGHTDNTGKADLNMILSQNRANAVKQYLISKGIDESRLVATGHGQDEPIADNKTAAGRAKNRRVEMKLGY
ncbi:MAG TPA: OmpA family protein [Chitinophagaceae bacterium]|jgi:outer membrane protein OmpA-like peptidoglycan-associated protein|nr:OmpA family protein [Chitinophagaceae bacterium]